MAVVMAQEVSVVLQSSTTLASPFALPSNKLLQASRKMKRSVKVSVLASADS
jgi:hypothetical protein